MRAILIGMMFLVSTSAMAQGFTVVASPADADTIDCAAIKADSRNGDLYCVYRAADNCWYAFKTSGASDRADAAATVVEAPVEVNVAFPPWMVDAATYKETLSGAIKDGLDAALPAPEKWFENELLWVGVAAVVVGAVVGGLALGGVFSADPGPTTTTVRFQ